MPARKRVQAEKATSLHHYEPESSLATLSDRLDERPLLEGPSPDCQHHNVAQDPSEQRGHCVALEVETQIPSQDRTLMNTQEESSATECDVMYGGAGDAQKSAVEYATLDACARAKLVVGPLLDFYDAWDEEILTWSPPRRPLVSDHPRMLFEEDGPVDPHLVTEVRRLLQESNPCRSQADSAMVLSELEIKVANRPVVLNKSKSVGSSSEEARSASTCDDLTRCFIPMMCVDQPNKGR